MAYDRKKSSFPYGEPTGGRADGATDMVVLPETTAGTDLAVYPYAAMVSVAGDVSIIPETHNSDTAVPLGSLPVGFVISCGIRRVDPATTATLVGFFRTTVVGPL